VILLSGIVPVYRVALCEEGDAGRSPLTGTTSDGLITHADATGSVVLEFRFSPPVVTDVNGWASVSMADLPSYGAPGEPILPFKTVEALIPQGGIVQSVRVSVGNERLLQGRYNLEYGKSLLPTSSDDAVAGLPKQEIYGSTDPFPGVWFSQVSEQSLKGYSMVVLRLHPVQYVPQSGVLSFFETMTVTFATVEGSVSPLFRNLPKDRLSVLEVVDNPAEADSYTRRNGILAQPTTLVDPSDSYDYVVITTSTLQSAFQPLINWKIAKGMKAKIVLVDDILNEPDYDCDGFFGDGNGTQFNDTQAHVRNFIKDAYQNWETEYVLLGSDDEVIPTRGMYDYAGDLSDYNIPCDMYYGCLDGSWDKDNDTIFGEAMYTWAGPENGTAGEEADFFAEVYVGRATVDTLQEAQNFVSKTLTYELSTGSAYLEKALMIGEQLDSSTEGGNGKDLVTEIIPQYTTKRLYYRDGTFDWSEVVNEMNVGVHIVNHDGHANEQHVMGLVNSDVDGLTNTDYFMAYSLGCYSAAFDEATSGSQEAIAEHFIYNAHGAFAYIGNSRYGWYSPGSTDGPGETYDRSFFNVLTSGTRNIGKALQYSKQLLYDTYLDRWTYYTLNLLGDPETEIVTDITAPTAHFRTRTDLLTPSHYSGEILLNGTAKRGPGAGATFDNYTVEFGAGLHPTSWSSAGISLTDSGETEITNDTLATWNTSLLSGGIYTLRLTVFDVEGHTGQDWMVVQVGLPNLIVEVYDSLGQPAAYTEIASAPVGSYYGWLFETTDAHGRLEKYVESDDWGDYILCASSNNYKFVLYKYVTIGSEQVTVIFNASQGVRITVHVEDIYGFDMEGAYVCLVLNGTTYNAFIYGTNSSGLIDASVYPATYNVIAMKGGDEAYYLFETNVYVNGSTYVSLEPTPSTVGTLYLNLEEVVPNEFIWFACWPHDPISTYWAFVWSASTVYLSPGSYWTGIRIGVSSPEWLYSLEGHDMSFTSGSSSSFDFGGHLNLNVQTGDRYTGGDIVEIAWNLTDAYQNRITDVYSSSVGLANVGETVAKNKVDGDYRAPTGTVNPQLQIIDPEATVLLDEMIQWWYEPYYYLLPTNPPVGTYTVRMTVDTGPYDGTLLAEDYFYSGSTLSVVPASVTAHVGHEFTVDVVLDYAENLFAYEFSLSFNDSVLNAVSVDYAGYLGTGEYVVYGPIIEINNTVGYVSFAISRLVLPAVTGGGVLATVHFTAVAEGTSLVSFFSAVLADDIGAPMVHETEDGQVTVFPPTNLVVQSIMVVDQGCNVYANDTYADGVTFFYVPVNVTVKNIDTDAAGAFSVLFAVWWNDGGIWEDWTEWRVSGLAADENVTLTYNWHPIHTGSYSLVALVDYYGEVSETDETDNVRVLQDFPVALMGDLYGEYGPPDHVDNILDIVQVGLAWHSHPDEPTWNIRADLNHDGTINILDIIRVTLRWHQTW
jgi:hypothetical protein